MTLDTPFLFKRARFYLFSGCLIIAIIGLLDIWPGEPKNLNEAEAFLFQSDAVVAQFGQIQTVKLRKWRRVSAAGEIPACREFRFYIKGKNREAMVTVRDDSVLRNGEMHHYSVVSIDTTQ